MSGSLSRATASFRRIQGGFRPVLADSARIVINRMVRLLCPAKLMRISVPSDGKQHRIRERDSRAS